VKKFVGEFREFISKGNLVDIAVGFVMGAAFSALIKAFVDNIVMPIIAIPFGKPNFDEALIATLMAYRMTGDSYWQKEARRAFNWFLGRNDLEIAIYDMTTGGCRDGLHQDRINRNQGAESTLSFLLSLAEMRLSQNILDASHELH
jgi:hypothetical protein